MSRVARSARVASRQRVETITGSKTIGAAETGELYIIDYNGGATATITLPPKQDGAYFKFVWKTKMAASSCAVKITSIEEEAGDFVGAILEHVTGGSNADSAMEQAAGTDFQVTLSKEIEPGTFIECVCDGSTWFVTGVANVESIGKVGFGA